VEPRTPAERRRFRLRGRDVCLPCDERRFPPPPAPGEPALPACTCGTTLRLELGPGTLGTVVISAYCDRCDKLTLPYEGELPAAMRAELDRLRRR
jgi:hypothetical protein